MPLPPAPRLPSPPPLLPLNLLLLRLPLNLLLLFLLLLLLLKRLRLNQALLLSNQSQCLHLFFFLSPSRRLQGTFFCPLLLRFVLLVNLWHLLLLRLLRL